MQLWSYRGRAWLAALSLGCFGLLAFGLALQDWYRLAPCPLCIFQRLLVILLGVLALLGCLCERAERGSFALMALVAVSGAATAAYQTWMQAFPHLAKECSYTDPNLIERLVDWLGMQYPELFLATGVCTSREWEFLGLSLANLSFIFFIGMAIFCSQALRRR